MDLIVDIGSVDNLIADGIVRLTREFIDQVSYLNRWRTFTVSASAFPKSMGHY